MVNIVFLWSFPTSHDGVFPKFHPPFFGAMGYFHIKTIQRTVGSGVPMTSWKSPNGKPRMFKCSTSNGPSCKKILGRSTGLNVTFFQRPMIDYHPPVWGFYLQRSCIISDRWKKHVLIWSTQLLSWVWPFYGRSTEVIYVIFVKF